MEKLFLFLSWFLLVSCGDSSSRVDSIDLDSCFLSYNNPAKLTEKLSQVSEKPHAPAFMVARGCLNYQLGHYSLAEEWITKAFQESKEGEEVKNLSASVLSLIYLKEFQKPNIKDYIPYANQHNAGRWMLILYHIDNYRETGLLQHLQKAITQVQSKHSIEGISSATKRLLNHMLLIKEMEELCGSHATSKEPAANKAGAVDSSIEAEDSVGGSLSSSAIGNTADDTSPCERVDLEDEKQYLFSTANGFLSMLIKDPPFNRLGPQTKKEESTDDL